MAFEREKLQRNLPFLGQTDKKKNVGRKKRHFLKNIRFYLDETMLELNSKGKDFMRRPRKIRLHIRCFEKNSFFSRKKIYVLGMYSIDGQYIAVTYKKYGGFR